MRITPLDVRKQEFRKVVRGLDSDEVQAFLATVADEYEAVLTDNKHLRDKVIELDEKVAEYRNMERTLRDTLLTAERVMTEARQNARKEAELILRDAQVKASQATNNIENRVDALRAQLRELRGQRDSFLARLQSLAEAQVGLAESYRKDFAGDDDRSERLMRDPNAPAAVVPEPIETSPVAETPAEPTSNFQTSGSVPPAPTPESAHPPVDGAPIAPPTPAVADDWRSYDIGATQAPKAPPAAPVDTQIVENLMSTPAPVEPVPVEPVPAAQTAMEPALVAPIFVEQVPGAQTPIEPTPAEPIHDATPPVWPVDPIDEVAGAVDAMLSGEVTPVVPPIELSGQHSAPVAPYPYSEPETASRERAEAAGQVPDQDPGTEPTEASESEATPESSDEAEGGRWSLSKFTRGLASF